MTDGTINIALLNFGNDVPGFPPGKPYYGLIHFGMWVDDLDEAAKKVEKAGGSYFMGRADHNPNTYYEVKYKDPNGVVFDLTHSGWKGAVKEVVPANEQGRRPTPPRMGTMATPKPVIIAGGGPVGLIVGLVLGRAGIKVRLFDQGDIVHSQPRAATIHPATLDILDDLGVYERIEPQGIVCPIVNYYDSKELLASFDHGLLKDETRHPWVLQCEQDKLSRLCSRWPRMCPTSSSGRRPRSWTARSLLRVESRCGRPTASRNGTRASIWSGPMARAARCARRIGVEFEGFTYPERFMIIGTPYDFAQNGYA